jgi:hypothetical protein
MDTKAAPLWKDKYPISDAEHVHHLDTLSAIHEFGSKLPRHEAEEKAYEDYKKDRHIESAAHHYNGLKAAHAVGDMETAKKHAVFYSLASKSLGLNPHDEPSEEISNKAKYEPTGITKFKPHKSDLFLLNKDKDHESND